MKQCCFYNVGLRGPGTRARLLGADLRRDCGRDPVDDEAAGLPDVNTDVMEL